MIDYVLFIFINVANIYISHIITERYLPNAKIDTYVLSLLVTYGFVATCMVLWLGIFGLLTPWIAATILLIALMVSSLTKKIGVAPINNLTTIIGDLPILKNAKFNITLIAFIGLLSVYAFRGLFDGTQFGWDDLSYHATAPAHWLQDKKITLAPQNYHMYFPFGAELFTTWLLLPMFNDLYASLSGMYWVILSVASIASIVYRISGNATSSLLSGLLFLSSAILREESIGRFTSVDLAGTAYILAALYFLILARRIENQEKHVYVVMVAVALGLAIGTKITYAACAILVSIFVAVHVFKKLKNPFVTLSALALIMNGIGSFWYFRNIFTTGNPVFPAALGPFLGPLIPEEVARTKLAYWIAGNEPVANLTNLIVIPHFNYGGLALGFISFMGLAWSAYFGFRILHNSTSYRHSLGEYWHKILPIIAVAIFMASIYPFLPFSGTANGPIAEFGPATRYILLLFALGLILFGCLFAKINNNSALWLIIICLAAASWSSVLPMDFAVATTSPIIFFVLFRLLRSRTTSARYIKSGLLTALICMFIIISFWGVNKEQRTMGILDQKLGGVI